MQSIPEIILFPNRSNHLRVIEVSGEITENTIWDTDTVKVVGDVNVNNEVILTINPGVIVEFQDHYKLSISGTIIASGSAENFIHFTSSNPELFSIDNATAGCWNGIRFENTLSTNEESILEYCIIEYSKAVSEDIIGGAISLYNFSKLKVINCIIQDNVAEYGGAIGCTYNSSPQIIGNLFLNNFALTGGSPFYVSYSYPFLTNNTVLNNEVINEEVYYRTGAVETFLSKPKITNNIIRNNYTNYIYGGQLIECKWFYTTYNNIEEGHPGDGNIDLYPFFIEEGPDPYTLSAISPCIDAGTEDTTGLNLPFLDILGNQRISDGNDDGFTVIDMGAYEYYYSTGSPNNDIVERTGFILNQNFPNPFNPSGAGRSPETTISFFTAEGVGLRSTSPGQAKDVEIIIYNIKGQRIKTLECNNHLPRCYNWEVIAKATESLYHITWNGKDDSGKPVGSGIYFYQLKVGAELSEAKKMILIK